MYDAGQVILCSFISPYEEDRRYVRELFPEGAFAEVYVKCDINECIRRDPKGLYKKAIAGEIENFTGISAPYEEPEDAEFVIETDVQNEEASIDTIYKKLVEIIGKGTV
jgi:adenylylsulfate kinase-like enzyme